MLTTRAPYKNVALEHPIHPAFAPQMSTDYIPIIDFAQFGDGSSPDARAVSKLFYEACRDVGFAYLINTGIPQKTVDDMLNWTYLRNDMTKSAKFFNLPIEVKNQAPRVPESQYGYSGVGIEQASQMVFDDEELAAIRKGKFLDFKESFDIADETCSASGFGHVNIWLSEENLPGFREFVLEYCRACRAFQIEQLLPALSIGMGFDKDFFNQYHRNGENKLRLLHYPEGPSEVFKSGEKGRIAAHTDFRTCTLLFQDDAGGLEIESPTEPGKFIPATPMRGAVVFNIGDLLMRWSNDTLKSTSHRVRAPLMKADDDGVVPERFSVPYFIAPDTGTIIDALPGCWGPDKPKKYAPIDARDYVDKRAGAGYRGTS
ncbi:hypothetical protein V5O48_015055 [Marasmius crinis-equi]|uniref:Fe2OG dioxygenase domain-containing protein n=1 Tax=Marasmius crinis-equi TaxID=585013 RepID=A0ABR3EVW2_9AGAR